MAVDDVAATSRDARVRSSVAASMLGKGAELVTLVLLATVVPRTLGPHAYGRFAVPLTIVTLGSLALTLGGPTVLCRFVPLAAPSERLGLARAIGARLARGRLLQLAAVAGVALLASLVDPGSFPHVATALVVVALAVSVVTSLLLQVVLGLGRGGPWSARYPIQNAALIGALLVLHRWWDGTGAVVAIVVSTVVAAAFAAAVVGPSLRVAAAPVPVPAGALRYGTWHAAGAGLTQVAQRGGVVVVAVLGASSEETGFAALAPRPGARRRLRGAPGLHGVAAPPRRRHADRHRPGGVRPPGPGDAPARGDRAAGRRRRRPAGRRGAGGVRRGVPRRGRGVRARPRRGGARPAGVAPGAGGRPSPPRPTPRSPVASRASGGFVLVAVLAVPDRGAAGATAAVLAGSAASIVVAIRLLPAAAGVGLTAASFVGAAAVLALARVRDGADGRGHGGGADPRPPGLARPLPRRAPRAGRRVSTSWSSTTPRSTRPPCAAAVAQAGHASSTARGGAPPRPQPRGPVDRRRRRALHRRRLPPGSGMGSGAAVSGGAGRHRRRRTDARAGRAGGTGARRPGGDQPPRGRVTGRRGGGLRPDEQPGRPGRGVRRAALRRGATRSAAGEDRDWCDRWPRPAARIAYEPTAVVAPPPRPRLRPVLAPAGALRPRRPPLPGRRSAGPGRPPASTSTCCAPASARGPAVGALVALAQAATAVGVAAEAVAVRRRSA